MTPFKRFVTTASTLTLLLAACANDVSVSGGTPGANQPATAADRAAAAPPSGTPQSPEEAAELAVRAAWDAMLSAYEKRDGALALQHTDAAAFLWYENVLEHARDIERDALNELPKTEKLAVLQLRHGFNREELQNTDVKALLKLGYERGAFGDGAAMRELKPAKIKVAGDAASMSFSVAPDMYAFAFVKEDGVWKFDSTDMLDKAEQSLPVLIQQSGSSEDQYLVEQIEKDTKTKVDRRIFIGPLETLDPQPLPAPTAITLKPIFSANRRAQISVPTNWRVAGSDRSAILRAAFPGQELYVVVNSEPSDGSISLDEYGDRVTTAILDAQQNGKIEDVEDMTINGLAAKVYVLSYSVENKKKELYPLRTMFALIDGDRQYYQISATTLAARFDANKTAFRQIIESFKVKK